MSCSSSVAPHKVAKKSWYACFTRIRQVLSSMKISGIPQIQGSVREAGFAPSTFIRRKKRHRLQRGSWLDVYQPKRPGPRRAGDDDGPWCRLHTTRLCPLSARRKVWLCVTRKSPNYSTPIRWLYPVLEREGLGLQRLLVGPD